MSLATSPIVVIATVDEKKEVDAGFLIQPGTDPRDACRCMVGSMYRFAQIWVDTWKGTPAEISLDQAVDKMCELLKYAHAGNVS